MADGAVRGRRVVYVLASLAHGVADRSTFATTKLTGTSTVPAGRGVLTPATVPVEDGPSGPASPPPGCPAPGGAAVAAARRSHARSSVRRADPSPDRPT